MKKTKFIILHLEIRNGEYEYNSKTVHEIGNRKNADAFGRNYAKEFYSNFSYADGDTFYFNGGEVAVTSQSANEITKAEYDILNKYL